MRFFLLLFTIGHILMAATIEHINVEGREIPVIFEQDTRLPMVTMQFTFTNSGNIADGKSAGLAKLSARLLNEGTKTLGSSAFAESLESRAISISAVTGTETFVLESASLKEEFDTTLLKLSELLSDPNYTPSTMKKIKTMTLGRLSQKENDFDYVASNELKAILFEGTPLAQPSAGTPQSISSITLRDVKGFVAKHLTRSNLIVVIGGDVTLDEVKDKIAKVIALLPEGDVAPVAHYDVRKSPKTNVLTRTTQQAYIYFGSPYHMAVDDKEYYKARVATFILGTGGFGSRLMEEIRVKRGLAYSAYARVHVSKSSSYLSGYLQTKTESMDEAKQTVEKVIAKFVKKGVTKEELEQTKRFLLGSEPLRVETMSQRLNRTFLEYYKGFKLGHSQKELQKIEKLKLKDLNEFIKKHSEINDLSFAIVTDK